ncbi:P1 family peptidase [Pseudalkalibacillus salsuginis]|uniref:DmpA family aminopeptidase n=1 Tax=Pseudalkalibacillus salsuginis TaxID=2910972 RepID=UPI001F1E762D|nr:P1 family peptidase [Pseudalkalibacillus salsuginis]MCF6409593.1 P1 family peptidase [Pseudalkalibacillus salsuginis]
MKGQKRIRDYGVKIGKLETGEWNAITDVEGVTVGHVTLADGEVQTGVTAVLPLQGNIFREKLIASSHVINGYGKTVGTIQIEELGTLETPILLTNTSSIGIVADALIDYMLEDNPEIGRETGTVNPVVGECNDMYLNDIRARSITKEHVFEAIENASVEFEEGAVGTGRGTLACSIKGGIGTSSRKMETEHGTYTLGVLVQSNFGMLSDFRVDGKAVGPELRDSILNVKEEKDKGSIMMIVATDLPVSERQLNRILKRTVTGLARTGSTVGNGSGDIALGFSTATRIPHKKPDYLLSIPTIHEADMDLAFRAVGEAVEEAILNSMITAEKVVGRDGNERPTLKDLIEEYDISLV